MGNILYCIVCLDTVNNRKYPNSNVCKKCNLKYLNNIELVPIINLEKSKREI